MIEDKINLIPQKEACAMTFNRIEELKREEIEYINEQIKQAINKGMFSIRIYIKYKETVNILKKQGYIVRTRSAEYYEIDWLTV